MPDLESVGDAVTGGMIGRAVEPKAGEAADGHTNEQVCLNCGAALSGPFCHQCGQQAHVHRTLTAFFHDFLHGVLHFEGKIWRTLPMLAWRPGELTRRYIDGQRARFVSPLALFLFCVFLTFAAMTLTGSRFGEVPAAAKEDIAAELEKDKAKLAKLEAERAQAERSGRPTDTLDGQIAELRAETAAIETIGGSEIPFRPIAVEARDLPSWMRAGVEQARANPQLLFYKLKTNAYKFSWALIPISVPFVWLLFPFSRRFRLYDHTVFVTYSLSFMMLLLVAGTLVGLVLPGLAGLVWLIPPVHMYRQLRGAYGVSRLGALWRTAALTIFAFLAIALFAVLLVAVGLL
ncbi:MAG: DUF3667 domain-containing protein [Alphaproteobacteria bacterium]